MDKLTTTLNYIKRKSRGACLRILEITASCWPAKTFLFLYYRLRMGKWLNLKNPQTYNEKLNWMKLYDRNPLYTILVDKLKAKDWVAERIGIEHIIPTIGVYDKFDDIDFDKLPDQFVIKCTHNCGVIVCPDKKKLDMAKAKKQIDTTMAKNYYWMSREWPYKDVPPKVIIDKYMVDESGYELKDYKFFCFDGEPKYLLVGSGRKNGNVYIDFYDIQFNHLPISREEHPNNPIQVNKPKGLSEMIEIARILSAGLRQVRVDLYDINGEIYFGEMTFFSSGGTTPFVPESWDYEFGKWINLDNK